MINFVTASGHGYTLEHLLPTLKRPARGWSYERLVRSRQLPLGTWVFTDHERLSAFENRVAAAVAQQLLEAGCRVLNHPAETRNRFALLDALWREGINQFRVYRADEAPRPARFPVFLRWEHDHWSAQDLIGSQADLDAALAQHRAAGIPLEGRLVIEFASDEASPGIWYRGSAYRVDGAVIGHHLAVDDKWLVKDGFDAGRLNVFEGREQFLARERSLVLDNAYENLLRRAFEIAGVQYGRADFGFADGKLQVYEINTNPNHAAPEEVFGNLHPERKPMMRHSEQRLRDALNAIDSDAVGSVRITGSFLAKQQQLFPLRPMTMRRP